MYRSVFYIIYAQSYKDSFKKQKHTTVKCCVVLSRTHYVKSGFVFTLFFYLYFLTLTRYLTNIYKTKRRYCFDNTYSYEGSKFVFGYKV